MPRRRIGVMSAEPPPSVNREPLAKSAPSVSASTNRSISAGSAEPSASNMTTMSPVTRAKPAARALPLPLRVCRTVMTPGRARRAAATVPSTEPPSTRMTSWTSGSCGRTTERFSASLSAGTTMLIRGEVGSVRLRTSVLAVSSLAVGNVLMPVDP